MANPAPDRLLGVRDGFLRFLSDRYNRSTIVVVVPQPAEQAPSGLAISDEEVLGWIGQRAEELETRLGDAYHFYVATEGGLHSLVVDGEVRTFIRNWTVLRSRLGSAVGSSGSIQLPDRIVSGLDGDQIRFSVPGTRKEGGLISSLTGGLESRRQAIAESTFHALSTLFYGVLESHPTS